MSDKSRKPPRIWIATILGLLYPGAGQVYANNYWAARIVVGVFFVFALALGLLRQFLPSPPLVAIFVILGIASIGCLILSGVQSFLAALRARRTSTPKGNRFIAAAIVLLITLVAQAFHEQAYVTGRSWHFYSHPSGSMEPTIRVGDRTVAAEGRLYLQDLRRGDIVITIESTGEFWVRRLIGLPGDTIEMKAGRLWHNGEPVPVESAPISAALSDATGIVLTETLEGRSYEILDLLRDSPGDTYPETVVPEGHIFLLGDNRDNAYDSRYVGPLQLSQIRGMLLIVFWSPERGFWAWPKRLK
jgi:signal peptidase I